MKATWNWFKKNYARAKTINEIKNNPIDVRMLQRYIWHVNKNTIPAEDKLALHVTMQGKSCLLTTEAKTDIDRTLKIELYLFNTRPTSHKDYANLKMDVESRMSPTDVQGMSVSFRDVLDYEHISIYAGNFASDKDFIESVLSMISSAMIYTFENYIKELE